MHFVMKTKPNLQGQAVARKLKAMLGYSERAPSIRWNDEV
jgi:hypothetical protein